MKEIIVVLVLWTIKNKELNNEDLVIGQFS